VATLYFKRKKMNVAIIKNQDVVCMQQSFFFLAKSDDIFNLKEELIR
jgi:hypothetical protein